MAQPTAHERTGAPARGEEKILALQEQKAELAAGVLSEDGEALAKFEEADIRALLEPLP